MHTSIVDTGGKLTAGVNSTDDHIFPQIYIDHGETGDQFFTGVNDDGGKLPPVSIDAGDNLLLLSTPLAVNCHQCKHH
jgi:hypothetical protein